MSYKIVEGLPSAVETEVNALVKQGWKRNGSLFPRIHDGYHLVVQGLYHPDEEISEPPVVSVSDHPTLTPSLKELIDRVTQEPYNTPPTLSIDSDSGNT